MKLPSRITSATMQQVSNRRKCCGSAVLCKRGISWFCGCDQGSPTDKISGAVGNQSNHTQRQTASLHRSRPHCHQHPVKHEGRSSQDSCAPKDPPAPRGQANTVQTAQKGILAERKAAPQKATTVDRTKSHDDQEPRTFRSATNQRQHAHAEAPGLHSSCRNPTALQGPYAKGKH